MQRGHFCIFHFHFFPSGPRDGCVRTTRPVFQLPRTLTTTVDANTIPLLIDRLCYRYPSFLVDAVTEHVPNERVVAVKNVTVNEPFFQGHFPGHPIMPGVLIVEALAQAGGILALKAMGGGKRIAYFTGIDNCKFRRPVVPGDQLRLEITVIARKGPMWKMHGEALVNGVIAAKGDVTATIPDGIEPGGPGDEE